MIGSLQKTSWGELVVVLTRQDKAFGNCHEDKLGEKDFSPWKFWQKEGRTLEL